MRPDAYPETERRILVLMRTLAESEQQARRLREAGFATSVCRDLSHLCDCLSEGAGALFLADEVVFCDEDNCLKAALRSQPAWSAIPLIVLAGEDIDADAMETGFSDVPTIVTFVEHPVRTRTLVSFVKAALRVRRNQHEIRDAFAERDRQAQALKDADRLKNEFLAMLAHELRNPLAPIRTGLDLLAMKEREPEIIGPMLQQVDHLVRLVDDLLDVSRIMRGRIELRKEPVELSQVIDCGIAPVRHSFEARGQSLSVEFPDAPVWLDADLVRLAQVVANLVGNASKYTPHGGAITIQAEIDPGAVVIRIGDSGIGIEPELLSKVFDLFTQAERTLDRSQGGLGIGLTVVKSLVEMHGGLVSVHSDGVGRGSEFTVRLPTIPPPDVAVSIDDSTPAAELRCCRILVVDDNTAGARLLARLLENLGPHRVEIAHDGEAALLAVEANRPELILLDIGLPQLDGYEVARRLRQQPGFESTLLVALTGYGTHEDRLKTIEAGFDEHLVKPPSVEMLRELLRHPRLSNC